MANAVKGRPSAYTQKLGAAICDRIATGESIRSICAAADMPDKATVFRWLAHADRQDFRDQYARAREAQADFLADEILEIADASEGDFIEKDLGDGQIVQAVDHEHIARSRLRVDARKWFAGKVAPKRYGDKITQEHTGPNGGPVRTITSILHEIDGTTRGLPAAEPAKPKG